VPPPPTGLVPLGVNAPVVPKVKMTRWKGVSTTSGGTETTFADTNEMGMKDLAPGPPGHELPPKPVATAVDEPAHVARVTSVHDDDPGVLPVPPAQATHADKVVAVAPPRE